MKLLSLLCLLAACLLATTGSGQEVKKDSIKYDMDQLEKGYGIKFKAAKLLPKKTEGDTAITITLEFTKEVKDLPSPLGLIKKLGNLRDLFAGKKASGLGVAGEGLLLKCYFFDEDGVVFTKQSPGKIEGELSGMEGDAFRVTQSVPGAVLAKTTKISFREEPAKK